jgi:hypothetical protein
MHFAMDRVFIECKGGYDFARIVTTMILLNSSDNKQRSTSYDDDMNQASSIQQQIS